MSLDFFLSTGMKATIPRVLARIIVLSMAVALLSLVIAGCNGGKNAIRIDPATGWEQGDGSEGRETIVITAAESDVSYRYGSAYVDTLLIRQQPLTDLDELAVIEVLVKGALADGCTELHEVIQGRKDGAINLNLRTRRPENALCTMAVRPFRFYLVLNEKLGVGDYLLTIEDRKYPFSVRTSGG